MNAPFNPVDFVHRLEREGIARGAAEAIAQGIEDRNRELATKGDLDRGVGDLKNELDRGVGDLKNELDRGVGGLKNELDRSVGDLKNELDRSVGDVKNELDRNVGDVKNELDRNVAELKNELVKFPTRPDLDTALARQTVQFGAIVAGGAGLLAAIAGLIMALK